MEGDFSIYQPKFVQKYVMIDWDETMSLNPNMVKPLFELFKSFNFIPKIFTARFELDDNSDIFLYVDPKDVLFANQKQKIDALKTYQLELSDVAFWIDDSPQSIISRFSSF